MKLSFRAQMLGSAATAVVLASGFAAPAAAAPANFLYAGGASFSEKVFRDIMNCYGSSSGIDLEANLVVSQTQCGGATGYRESIEAFYVGVGSGRGLNAWKGNDPSQYNLGRAPDNPPVVGASDSGLSFYGNGGFGAGWTPVKTSGAFYPRVSFSGSDDPVGDGSAGTSLAAYNCANAGIGPDCTAGNTDDAGSPRGWGPAVQLPAMIGTVAVAYRADTGAGWSEKGKTAAGNNSKLDLTPDLWCGIFTGAIQNWNDIRFKTNNGNTALVTTSSPIDVAYRNDGSGTTFIFANALLNQCGTSSAPGPGVSAASAVPDGTIPGDTRGDWITDSGTIAGGPNGTTWLANNDFYLKIAASGGAGTLPANFHGAPGNAGIKAALISAANAGWVGYLSPDFVNLKLNAPDSTGPSAANLQSYATAKSGSAPLFKAPSYQNAVKVMTWSVAESNTYLKVPSTAANCTSLPEGCALNPVAWGKVNPVPVNVGAYPIAGFSYMLMYTCYANIDDAKNLASSTAGALGFVRWYYGSSGETGGNLPKLSLNKNGFSQIPGSYSGKIKNPILKRIGKPGFGNTSALNPCKSVVGPGA